MHFRSTVSRAIFSLLFAGLLATAAGARSSVAAAPLAESTPQKVLIDSDPGTDDALAILLALNSPEVDVKGISIVAGNVTADMGFDDALKILSLAGRCDIPVAKGADHPLLQPLVTGTYWNGANGLGGAEIPPSKCEGDKRFGPDLIIDLVHKYPHELVLIPIGPLTNIALAVRKDPSIASLVKGVVLMGGSISGGNVNGAAEYNIYQDPEAAAIVFNAGWPLTMVGLDVTEKAAMLVTDAQKLEAQPGPIAHFAAVVARYQISVGEAVGGGAVHDALAVGAVIDPSLLGTKFLRVDVETGGAFARGETVANRTGSVERNVPSGDHMDTVGLTKIQPNVHVAVTVEGRRFIDMLITRLGAK
ncbi:MAG: nucleoside hydrolase [Candidatus Acidiferrales bacterium]